MPIYFPKRLLLSALDWGLGHSSRLVPIINYLNERGHQIVFAGNDWQRKYIENTFPGIENLQLEGYNISYNKSGNNLMLSVLLQSPGILKTIRKEQKWLNDLVKNQKFDGIISDNRYGLYHKNIPSVIITHQLEVQTGLGQTVNNLFRRFHYKLLQRFDECWVPDLEGKISLADKMSHPVSLPKHVSYIGWLSQFAGSTNKKNEGKNLLVLLSGPEPQRSILSKILWEQLLNPGTKTVFVEGSNDVIAPAEIPAHISYHKQITKDELLPLLQDARMVICRSGYSTIMDLVALQKKAILIPTPGQTEQEYLAKHLHEKRLFNSSPQKNFNLKNEIENANKFHFENIDSENAFQRHEPVIDKWLLQV